MVVFSYGIPKSGSTLAFQIAACIARLGGHRQALLPAHLRAARGHRVNFAQDLVDPEVLRGMVAHAGDRLLLVKTHARPGPAWLAAYRELAASGLVAAHVNHRDPRDICLALLDAGTQARRDGQQAFAEFVELADAVAAVQRYLDELAEWSALPNRLDLRYEVCAFRMDEAIDQIKAAFGIACPNWAVRLYAGRIAFTHRNRAVPQRHRRDLDAATVARLTRDFAPYLRAMGYDAADSAMAR